ncbi:MAG: redoxin family protein [Caulobacteraceae bacterium]|nr:redoxin family protein [Caulobacteraceae bacterium]
MFQSSRRKALALGSALALAGGAVVLFAGQARAAPAIGQPAPAFAAADADGKVRTLDEFKGRTVVLEWTNQGCPYVKKHYNSGNMQALQKSATDDGVVWLTLISSAPGEQGHLDAAGARAWKARASAGSSAVLLDPQGRVGRAYDARTTPHMYVIDKVGTLVYMGGIDDKPTSDLADIKAARNYVVAALGDVKAGRPVAEAVTRPYGCNVKYAG